MFGIEIKPTELQEDDFAVAVMDEFAGCYGSNSDSSCGGVNTCKLVELLKRHRRQQQS